MFAETCPYEDRHIREDKEDEDLRSLKTDLLQGNNVAFVQVHLGCTQLFP